MLVAWLHGLPEIIRSSSAFVPFLGFWGLGFAYQVGRMILAHVTKQPFPLWNGMMAWTAVGMLDANLGRFLGRCASIRRPRLLPSGAPQPAPRPR